MMRMARGNEKTRVERFIGFLRHSFFAAPAFTSVADLNAQLAHWTAEVAHARPAACCSRPGDRPEGGFGLLSLPHRGTVSSTQTI
jgi:hypothetical protein